jgi:hypothetical protein
LEIPSRVSRSNRDRSPRQIGNRSPPPLPEPSQGKQYSSLSRRSEFEAFSITMSGYPKKKMRDVLAHEPGQKEMAAPSEPTSSIA